MKTEFRTRRAPDYEGKAAWFGQYRDKRRWLTARSGYGRIIYTSRAHALAGVAIYAQQR